MSLTLGDRLAHYDVTVLIGEGGMGGDRLGHYDVTALIGEGGMGEAPS